MNVLPSNQTVILASERRTGGSPKTLEQALSAASSAATLKRVTIVAAHPDTTLLYVQADYSPTSGSTAHSSYARPQTPDDSYSADVGGASGGALVATSSSRTSVLPGTARRDAFGNARSSNGAVEQYASTQRILTQVPAAPHVNVHA